MNRTVAALVAVALLAGLPALAADAAVELEPMKPNLEDLPSLQRGMALYMNYCIGCHSLKYQRYQRTAEDLGIPRQVVEDNLIFTGQAIGSLMRTSMPLESAKNWFGAPPPDLTLVDRVRGTAWIYNMLKNFYVDPKRPFGVNNRVFPNIGMPHVLIDLQGVPRLDETKGYKPIDLLRDDVLKEDSYKLVPVGEAGGDKLFIVDGNARAMNTGYIKIDPGTGSMSAEQFDQAAYDIANFLHYVGEPGRAKRKQIGIWVLAFLAGLFALATLLNREYWKDVH